MESSNMQTQTQQNIKNAMKNITDMKILLLSFYCL